MNDQNRGIRSGGAFVWFMQRISGAVLLLALLLHFWVLHFFPFGSEHGEITFDIVMKRLSHPLWRTIDLLFLVVGLYHGMNGIILVVNDYIRNSRWRTLIVGVLWVAALFFLIIGSMTILGLSGRMING